jgi:DNA-binding CsgD family transcriptional regulator
VIAPFGLHGELRASFVNGSTSWGCAILLRGDGRDFTADEASFVTGVVGIIGHGFRTALAPVTLDAVPAATGPGLVLLDEHDRITAVTPPAELWVDALASDEPVTTGPAPAAVLAVAATARAQALHQDAGTLVARARARTADGRWVVLHGSVLESDGEIRTAVILEPAEPGDLAPLVVEALGLTLREQDIVRSVLLGWSTDRIAEVLHLSPYTVQDHLKSVFAKAGVRSRRDLAARIFFQHYAPRLSDEAALGPSGWLSHGPT